MLCQIMQVISLGGTGGKKHKKVGFLAPLFGMNQITVSFVSKVLTMKHSLITE